MPKPVSDVTMNQQYFSDVTMNQQYFSDVTVHQQLLGYFTTEREIKIVNKVEHTGDFKLNASTFESE